MSSNGVVMGFAAFAASNNDLLAVVHLYFVNKTQEERVRIRYFTLFTLALEIKNIHNILAV